ncbi:FAD-dependent oxidoreductase [Aspergillus mulundensis]|uniref:FAD-binding domain-containing protein n=1 Tax=Aspergillus mulundensis TaxID=1810919 RepID=A0A3D8SWK0_9EURO|nr:Uncharacterized protein DSM5745_02429 [Aspergillus mulundensis]RDW90654.1 Uncharacterized protein DSM5745_02429 [Aspergillus mulundensis]
MKSTTNSSQLRVIIIGGAVSGLTLAHCLEKAGIDYVVLEKHQDITTNIGGSVALQPAGCRILDQLGILDHLGKCTTDIQSINVALPDGYTRRHPMFARNLTGIGYPFTALTRRNLLYALFTSLEGRSKVKTGTRVVDINPNTTSDGRLTVTTEKGEKYTGDIVVGADGVHGITLREMWRLADSPLIKDKSNLTVDYTCCLGMTTPTKGTGMTATLKPGEIYTRSYPHAFWTIIPNADSTINWFVMIKMDQTYVHPNVPRWSQAEVKAKLEELGDHHLYGNIKFRDLWQITPSVASTPTPEGILKTWAAGRMAGVGDTVFKVASYPPHKPPSLTTQLTPNFAQGANLCIESSAALANCLQKLNAAYTGTTTKPTDAEIRHALTSYRATIHPRIKEICDFSYRMSRVHSLETPLLAQFMIRYVIRVVARFAHYTNTKEYESGMVLEYLPLPERDQLFKAKRARTLATWKANIRLSTLGVLVLLLTLASVFLFSGTLEGSGLSGLSVKGPLFVRAGLGRVSVV